jgi:hypothetical protein
MQNNVELMRNEETKIENYKQQLLGICEELKK